MCILLFSYFLSLKKVLTLHTIKVDTNHTITNIRIGIKKLFSGGDMVNFMCTDISEHILLIMVWFHRQSKSLHFLIHFNIVVIFWNVCVASLQILLQPENISSLQSTDAKKLLRGTNRFMWLIDWLYIVYRSIQEYISHKGTSSLPVKGWNIWAFVLPFRSLSRQGFLSCHTCYDTGPRFTRFHPRNVPFSPLLRKARCSEDLAWIPMGINRFKCIDLYFSSKLRKHM